MRITRAGKRPRSGPRPRERAADGPIAEVLVDPEASVRSSRRSADGILNAIRLGLSNSRLEGLASRIRLISHRSFGFHSAEPLIALIHLCCGRITVTLPT